jgi:hypothetical protein
MFKTVLSSILVLAAVGCIDSADQPQVDTTDRIIINGMLPSELVTTTLGTAAVTGTALTPYLDGTKNNFVGYLVGCALGSTQTVNVNGTVFGGTFGIAPAWTTRALTVDEQRLVSACMLSRVNLNGINVTISSRSQSTAFATTTPEVSGYTYEEGGFWGNVLGGTADLHTCMGDDQHDYPLWNGDITKRKCAGSSACGFTYEGLCSSVCSRDGNGNLYVCGGNRDVVTIDLNDSSGTTGF